MIIKLFGNMNEFNANPGATVADQGRMITRGVVDEKRLVQRVGSEGA